MWVLCSQWDTGATLPWAPLVLTQEHSKAQPAQCSHAWAPTGIKDSVRATCGQQRCHLGCHQCFQRVPVVPSLTMGAHNEGV